VVALSGDHPVGVDIERVDEASGLASARVVLHPEERAGSADELTKVWVRKESLLKATGDGLRVAPADIRLSRPVDAPRLLEWVGRELPAASMRDLAIDGYSACLTVLAS
jgi:4'-phosphopantetheinyl transferase